MGLGKLTILPSASCKTTCNETYSADMGKDSTISHDVKKYDEITIEENGGCVCVCACIRYLWNGKKESNYLFLSL